MRRKLTDDQLIAQGLNPLFITKEFLEAHNLSETFPERFMRHVEKTDDHWFWTAACTQGLSQFEPKGHGQITKYGSTIKIGAHVASWLLHNGEIPAGMMVLHKCPGGAVPYCVNPAHLYLGTSSDNMRDLTRAGRNHFSKARYGCKGEKNWNAKTNWETVRAIRREYTGEKGQQAKLSRKYNLPHGLVSMIIRNRRWIEF